MNLLKKFFLKVIEKLYDKDKNRQYENEDENIILLKKHLKEIEEFEGSKQERYIKATIIEEKVKKVSSNTKNEYNQKKEYQMITTDNNLRAELSIRNKYVTRQSLI